MREFMLLVRNEIDNRRDWSPEQHLQFLKKCEAYVGALQHEGKLKAAQPLAMEGPTVAGPKGIWHEMPFGTKKEVVVGTYHVVAETLDEAIAIARRNPEFDYGTTARVEVRPIKPGEEATGFAYPEGDL